MTAEYRKKCLEHAIQMAQRDATVSMTADEVLAEWGLQRLTAYEASRAAPDDVVERVARAIGARHEAGYVVGSLYSENMRELARAALSALPARDDALEGLLAKALRRLAYWAQTSGGTAGRDDGLVAAIDVGLAALRQYDTKHAAPAQEPRS